MNSKLRFHHIGIATKDIEETKAYLNDFFDIKGITSTVYDEKQSASLCMVTLEDGTNIELISGEQVKSMIAKRRYLYHTCYETDNIEDALKEFEKNGDMIISEPKEAVLFGYKKVAFVMTLLGIVELVES